MLHAAEPAAPGRAPREITLIERVHADLGRLGVVWHTQGSGKSYSMLFFAEKVRRTVPGDYTFLLITDRNDLGHQIYKTFVVALPNAAFIGFTGTPLFNHDHLTQRIFGGYVSRYDFKRSEKDGAKVRLVYENRGEKLSVARGRTQGLGALRAGSFSLRQPHGLATGQGLVR